MWPPFVNQLVVEGAGALDAEAWRAAVAAVLPAWPAARARLRGALGWTRWVAAAPPGPSRRTSARPCAAMPTGFADGGRLDGLVAEMVRRIGG
jgi:hypothetical protein